MCFLIICCKVVVKLLLWCKLQRNKKDVMSQSSGGYRLNDVTTSSSNELRKAIWDTVNLITWCLHGLEGLTVNIFLIDPAQ